MIFCYNKVINTVENVKKKKKSKILNFMNLEAKGERQKFQCENYQIRLVVPTLFNSRSPFQKKFLLQSPLSLLQPMSQGNVFQRHCYQAQEEGMVSNLNNLCIVSRIILYFKIFTMTIYNKILTILFSITINTNDISKNLPH